MSSAEAAEADPAWAVQFVAYAARLRKDGEGPDPDDETVPWEMENDHAYDELHELISDARALLGWEAGSPPLDSAEYLAVTGPDDPPLVHGRVYEDARGEPYLYREKDLDGICAAPHFLAFGVSGRVGLDEPVPPLRPYGAT